MSETLLAAVIGAGVTLFVTVITQITTVAIAKYRSRLEIQNQEFQSKREKLNEVYKTLISIVNHFPEASPTDILERIECAPNYSLENFDSVLKSLDFQIEDYQKQLDHNNMSYEERGNIEVQISNREYAKKKIIEISEGYYNAEDEYKSFYETDKATFDLYAGQTVRDNLVNFEVTKHNVFQSGHSVGDVDDPLNNIVTIARRNLISSMRNDLGIN